MTNAKNTISQRIAANRPALFDQLVSRKCCNRVDARACILRVPPWCGRTCYTCVVAPRRGLVRCVVKPQQRVAWSV
jgi:hypothetical protein